MSSAVQKFVEIAVRAVVQGIVTAVIVIAALKIYGVI